MILGKKPFENILRKGEIVGNQHFLIFPECFLSYSREIAHYVSHIKILICYAFNLDKREILSSGAEPHSSVGRVRTWEQMVAGFFPRIDDCQWDRILSPLTAV